MRDTDEPDSDEPDSDEPMEPDIDDPPLELAPLLLPPESIPEPDPPDFDPVREPLASLCEPLPELEPELQHEPPHTSRPFAYPSRIAGTIRPVAVEQHSAAPQISRPLA